MLDICIERIGVEVIICVGIFELCCGDDVIQNRVKRRFKQEQDSCFMPDCCGSGDI